MIDYCTKHKILVQASAKKPYSMERNLLSISYEAGILEDPWFDSYDLRNRGCFCTLVCLPEDAPDKPEFVEFDFVKGDWVAVTGEKLNPLGVIKTLNRNATVGFIRLNALRLKVAAKVNGKKK